MTGRIFSFLKKEKQLRNVIHFIISKFLIMICFPNSKINLGLFVTNKRSDGYHDLETVFYPLLPRTGTTPNVVPGAGTLNDVLEIVPAQNEGKLYLSGLPVNGDSNDNLVWKAYTLLQNKYPTAVPALDIYLHKAMPMGAGIGGGSGDGAFMLRLINDYCHLNLTDTELAGYALQLGSDCPFFIFNTPQYARGRGEVMTPVHIDLSVYDLHLICPDVHVSTRTAFAGILPKAAPYDLKNLEQLPITDWKEVLCNDFEQTVFGAHAVLGDLKNELYNQGAIYASMTGTGSAIYGIFYKDVVVKIEGHKHLII